MSSRKDPLSPTRREFLVNSGLALLSIGAVNEVWGDNTLRHLLDRSSYRFIVNPKQYMKPEATKNLGGQPINMVGFQNNFEWKQDDLNGMYDVVQDVEKTIETQQGDCVDYSGVVLSWLYEHTDEDMYVGTMVSRKDRFPSGHVSVYSDGTLYDVHETFVLDTPSLAEFANRNGYELVHISKVENTGDNLEEETVRQFEDESAGNVQEDVEAIREGGDLEQEINESDLDEEDIDLSELER